MGSLHKKVKKFASKIADKRIPTFSPGMNLFHRTADVLGKRDEVTAFHDDKIGEAHPVGDEMERQYDVRKEAEAAAVAAENEPVIPLPDEEELARMRRRRSRRGTGRSSTVLTDQERFGV